MNDGSNSEIPASPERPARTDKAENKRSFLPQLFSRKAADSPNVHEQRRLAGVRATLAQLGGKQKETMHEKKDPMDDLKRVGPDKAVGYLHTSAIRAVCHEDPERLLTDARDRGLYATIVHPGTSKEALYIADPEALQAVLERHRRVFEGGIIFDGIPTTEEFITIISGNYNAPPKSEIYDTIADAFGDYTNKGRTDVHDKKADKDIRKKQRRRDKHSKW